jgi:sulfite reductase (NADPH) flavoprotein alpha-component
MSSEPSLSRKTVVFFGTQSGNSEKLARALAKLLEERGHPVLCCDLDDFPERRSPDALNLVITSSYGKGGPPSNAERFERWLSESSQADLASIDFAVFGLGDRSYPNFCGFAKTVSARLKERGGRETKALSLNALDYHKPFGAWCGELFPKLASLGDPEPDPPTAMPHPLPIVLTSRKFLTEPTGIKQVFHAEFHGPHGLFRYQPGDTLAIHPTNATVEIHRFLNRFGFDGKDRVEIDGRGCRLIDALFSKRELRWAGLSEDRLANHSPAISNPQMLVDRLLPMAPRRYSISSSPLLQETVAAICVGQETFMVDDAILPGLTSQYLYERVAIGGTVAGKVVSNERFRLPEDSKKPIIMIGAGTGIAPYRGFLQHRERGGVRSPAWLLWGNRSRVADYLYGDEMDAHRSSGNLTELSLAFSRDPQSPRYVQDLLEESKKQIWSWIMRGAVIYLCGDATKMAKAVHQQLIAIIAECACTSAIKAEEMLRQMARRSRYCRDVY